MRSSWVKIQRNFETIQLLSNCVRYFVGYKAATAGAKHQEAVNHLEKKLKKEPELDLEETIELAITTLSNVLSLDFKPADLEIAIVHKDDVKFKVLTENEIEAHLTRIIERAD